MVAALWSPLSREESVNGRLSGGQPVLRTGANQASAGAFRPRHPRGAHQQAVTVVFDGEVATSMPGSRNRVSMNAPMRVRDIGLRLGCICVIPSSSNWQRCLAVRETVEKTLSFAQGPKECDTHPLMGTIQPATPEWAIQ